MMRALDLTLRVVALGMLLSVVVHRLGRDRRRRVPKRFDVAKRCFGHAKER
jgi:hypothetical protein